MPTENIGHNHTPRGDKAASTFHCPQCDTKFIRRSHLLRHMDSHLPAHERNGVPCGECGKVFSRKDVLHRHQRGAHAFQPLRKRTAQKSCFRCAGKKLKCDRRHPCAACDKVDADCQYPSTLRRSTEPARATSRQDPDVSQSASHFGPFPEALTNPLTEAEDDSMRPGRQEPQTTYSESMHSDGFPNVFDFGECDFDWWNLDLDVDFDKATDVAGTAYTMEGISPSDQMYPNSVPSMMPNLIQRGGSDKGDLTWPEHIGKATPRLISSQLPNQKVASSDDIAQQWPFYSMQDADARRQHLSPANAPLTLQNFHGSECMESHFQPLIQLFSGVYLPDFATLQEPGLHPTFELLRRSVDNYIANFHSILPFIHLPTWEMKECPTVLLSAMACIGAMYNEPEEAAKEESLLFSQICERSIISLGAADSRNYLQLELVMGSCLHQIYSLGSGNRQLYQNADRARGLLTGALRGMGLLRSRVGLELEADDLNRPRLNRQDDLANDWLIWRNEEQERRLAWAVFEYDCSLCTLTSSKRGAVDLPELPNKLPCAESLWDAPSAQAWTVLKSHMSTTAVAASMTGILRHLLLGQAIPDDLSLYARRICSQVLARLLWDLKQIHTMSMTDHLGLPSLAAAQKQTKDTLLNGLKMCSESLSKPTSTAALISHNVTSLIYHHSMLCASGEVIDLVTFIIRNTLDHQTKTTRAATLGQHRLASTFANDPAFNRRLVWHAAQIIGNVHRYPVPAPCEVIRVFTAYAFIIAFSKYSASTEPREGDKLSSVTLDNLLDDDFEDSMVANWVLHGGVARVGSVSDICSKNAVEGLVCEGKSLLQKLRPWTLAWKFTRILDSLDSGDRRFFPRAAVYSD